MRVATFMSVALLVGLCIAGCAHYGISQRRSADADLQKKLVGEWTGSRSINTNQVLSWKTVIHSDNTFSTQNSTYDNSGHLLHVVQMDGKFVVTNGAAVVTFTKSSENDTSLPRTIRAEPIVRVDDHELVIITKTGAESVSRRALR